MLNNSTVELGSCYLDVESRGPATGAEGQRSDEQATAAAAPAEQAGEQLRKLFL